MPFQYKNRGAIKRGFRNKLRADMTYAAEKGAEAMRRVIERTREDRTGWMLGNVTSEGPPQRFSGQGTRYTAFWGWKTEIKNLLQSHARMTERNYKYKSYFDLQEFGFQHTNGKFIEGMNSYKEGRRAFYAAMKERGW